MVTNVFGKSLVQLFRSFFKYAEGDVDPGAAKLGESLAADEWIRVLHARDNARDSCSDYCIRAGRSAALMGTRFEVDIESCAASFFSGLFEGKDLGMLHAVVGVAA